VSPPPSLDFWFEFASTYSYPAALTVGERARRMGVALRWRPFLLGPIFASQGWSDSPFNLQPAKGRYMWRDVARICAQEGLPWRRPSAFPRGSLLAARVALAAESEPWVADFVRAVFRANFAEDRPIGEPAVVSEILERLGQTSSRWLERASERGTKARLRARGEEARRLGLFGAPAFVVGSELFWGHDRLDAALAWATGRSRRPQGRAGLEPRG